MARTISRYTVEDEGRDKGKIFVITEMSAEDAEDWAIRVLLALVSSGVNLPDNVEELGTAGLAELGFKALAGLKWEIGKPLLREMLSCVQIMPDPRKAHVVRELIPSDIEEILTRMKLRVEVWKIHMGFLNAAAQSVSVPKPAAKRNPEASHIVISPD